MEIRNSALVCSRPLEGSRGAYMNELDSTRAGFSRELVCLDLRNNKQYFV